MPGPGLEKSGGPLERLKQASRWLHAYRADVHSQNGEDGVLAKALALLPERDLWCVEFGAWDGQHLSNTFNLVEAARYRAVLIEGDALRYAAMCASYPFREQANFVHRRVGWSREDGLDAILKSYPVPRDFDLLSIDVDGNDFHIWRAMQEYRPKLVVVEFNKTASNRSRYVQPAQAECNRGASPGALVELGKEKGYELVCVLGPNLIFVDARYFDRFEIPDNSLEVMREEDEVTSVMVGYDGHLVADGPAELLWHGIKFRVKQPLWGILQRYPPGYGTVRRKLFEAHRFLDRHLHGSR